MPLAQAASETSSTLPRLFAPQSDTSQSFHPLEGLFYISSSCTLWLLMQVGWAWEWACVHMQAWKARIYRVHGCASQTQHDRKWELHAAPNRLLHVLAQALAWEWGPIMKAGAYQTALDYPAPFLVGLAHASRGLHGGVWPPKACSAVAMQRCGQQQLGTLGRHPLTLRSAEHSAHGSRFLHILLAMPGAQVAAFAGFSVNTLAILVIKLSSSLTLKVGAQDQGVLSRAGRVGCLYGEGKAQRLRLWGAWWRIGVLVTRQQGGPCWGWPLCAGRCPPMCRHVPNPGHAHTAAVPPCALGCRCWARSRTRRWLW